MPEGAVVVHLGEHERGGTGGTFERGAVELDDQPVGQSRPIGVAKDENPAGIDIVIGFDQGDEISDKGHIGDLSPYLSKAKFTLIARTNDGRYSPKSRLVRFAKTALFRLGPTGLSPFPATTTPVQQRA